MWLSFYNPRGVGDVLMLTSADLPRELIETETLSDVTRIYNKENKETIGYNINNISTYMEIKGTGHVLLEDAQIEQINQLFYEQGFETIKISNEPRIVVGKVLECVDHENSDHLHVTQTQVGPVGVQQIVCGASNIDQGQTVVVALSGAVMPNGQIIWPGELRGVKSNGMICSAYELGLDPDHERQGILVLDDELTPGTPFESIKEQLN